MYGEVKNPFGLRNGKYITVNDLTEDERGLACNCVCPYCKDSFEARLGTVRIHHFSHSGEGCDEVASYLMGLYGFFKDYASTSTFKIPELCVYYQVDKRFDTPVTLSNYAEQLSFYAQRGKDQRKITLSEERPLNFDSAEIVFRKNKRPEAVIAAYHGRHLAFVISPPDTVCSGFKARPYKDMATLEILLSQKAELINRANTEKMNAMFSDVNNYRWLSSPLVQSAFEQINTERKEALEAYKKELEQIHIQQEELRRKLVNDQREAEGKEIENSALEEAEREAADRKYVEEQIKIPNQVVKDSHNRRWFLCVKCGKIATEKEFWKHRWNRGECIDCEGKEPSQVKMEPPQTSQAEKNTEHLDACPWCGGKLIKRNGKHGDFIGCSTYPKCRYTRNI